MGLQESPCLFDFISYYNPQMEMFLSGFKRKLILLKVQGRAIQNYMSFI